MGLSARQIEILQVSLGIISKEGVQNFTMRQIAAEIGISEPAIYRHFPNKVSILEALLVQFEERHKLLAEEFLNGMEFSGIGKFLLSVLKNLAEQPALSAIIFSEEIFQNEPALRQKVTDIMKNTESAVIEHLNRLPIGQIIPVKYAAWMFLGSVRFLVTRWRLSGFSFDLVAEGSSFIDTLTGIHSGNSEERG
ncbi:MAG: TetR/AcrR family transcriptional regulator [Fibrobacteres bacterium]|nr:TetR/AcrR family transcriptional regulator [Fibrobacterota bacterium]